MKLLAQNLMSTLKHCRLFDTVLFLAELINFHGSSQKSHTLLQVCAENLVKALKHDSLFKTLLALAKSTTEGFRDFHKMRHSLLPF